MMGRTPLDTPQQHVQALIDALEHLDGGLRTAESWGAELAPLLERGQRLLAVGNGGSAADAQHLTAELVGRYRDDRPPFSAIALHADTSSLTAIVNDYGTEHMFARQVRAHARPGDVLVAISTSGRSRNVLAAAKAAHACGVRVWALTGPGPNPLTDLADGAICAESGATSTLQEVHGVLVHVLCAAVDRRLNGELAAPTGRRSRAAGHARRGGLVPVDGRRAEEVHG